MPLDPRVNPVRPDLAAAHLAGQVEAERFVEGVRMQVRAGVAPLRVAPERDAAQGSQVLHGEVFTVYELRDGWCWGQLATDSYVGYVRADALAADIAEPTHLVRVPRTFLFPRATFKSTPIDLLSLGSRVAVAGIADGYAELAGGGHVWAGHLGPLDDVEPDTVATALQFVGAPYLWGGRSSIGIDCSGLAQVSLGRAGVAIPRDSSMQATVVGEALPTGTTLRRGDLVFFPGHVGLMRDETQLVHATAHYMQVVVEPLETVAARAGGITGMRRLGG